MLYFAYGSNLNVDQLHLRCGYVKKITNYRLPNYRLVYDTGPKTHSYANIIVSPGDHVDGVIYDINFVQECALDIYEGVPKHYRRHFLHWENELLLVYIGNKQTNAQPDYHYLWKIKEGYVHHGLAEAEDIITKLIEKLYL